MPKVALVTGGTRGIGGAVAELFMANGYKVIATYRDNVASAEAFVKKHSLKPELVQKCDLASDADVERLSEVIRRSVIQLDVLVNNAGTVIAPSDWSQMTRTTFLDTLNVNLVGASLLTKRVLPLLEGAQNPAVLNMGSTYGFIADPWIIAYSAAKAGVIQLTRALAKQLAPRVRVNAILPGHIDTDMTRSASAEFIQKIIHNTPLGRLGRPTEVAQLAMFLVSEHSQFITGQTFVIDGGHSLR
jgi:NAD(P)-dependent dehydrogenase (short-subunit alcohol dehydrogenase family)